jgi:hypothetical protein
MKVGKKVGGTKVIDKGGDTSPRISRCLGDRVT